MTGARLRQKFAFQEGCLKPSDPEKSKEMQLSLQKKYKGNHQEDTLSLSHSLYNLLTSGKIYCDSFSKAEIKLKKNY